MNKKIISLAVALLLIVVAALSATFAYFQDTDYVKNEFTVGNVEIDLTEGAWVKNDATGNIEPKGDGSRLFEGETALEDSINNYGKLYPGMSIYKDPIVENTGSEDAYVAIKLTITDGEGDITKIAELFPYAPYINVSKIVSGGLSVDGMTYVPNDPILGTDGIHTTDDVTVKQVPKGNGVWEIYLFATKALKTGESVEFFNTITIPETWDHAEMSEFVNFDIEIQAYATQTNGFANCVEAVTTAFGMSF